MPEAPRARNLVLILAKDLASRLATPAFVVDREGTLLYFNEAAEPVLGMPYAEAGEMRGQQWAKLFEPRDDEGSAMSLEELPMSHQAIWRALESSSRNSGRNPAR